MLLETVVRLPNTVPIYFLKPFPPIAVAPLLTCLSPSSPTLLPSHASHRTPLRIQFPSTLQSPILWPHIHSLSISLIFPQTPLLSLPRPFDYPLPLFLLPIPELYLLFPPPTPPITLPIQFLHFTTPPLSPPSSTNSSFLPPPHPPSFSLRQS